MYSWVIAAEDCGVKMRGREMVTCGLCSQWRTLHHVIPSGLHGRLGSN